MKRAFLVIPISILIHLGIINLALYLLTPETYLPFWNIVYYNFSWLLIAYSLDFYTTGRKERFFTNLAKPLQQYIIFGLAYFAFLALRKVDLSLIELHINIFFIICFFLLLSRVTFYTLRRSHRLEGGDYVNVVVIGRDGNLKKLREVFNAPNLGYRYKGYFSNEVSKGSTYLGPFEHSLDYIIENNVDEIYCMESQLEHGQIRRLRHFADTNFKKLKIVPANKEIYTRTMSIELYDTLPVLNLRALPLDKEYGRVLKRMFDLVFSSLVILGVLSWLMPLIYILMKFDSKGALFFKQQRHGVNRKVFWCYKFRCVTVNENGERKMATRHDMRITKLGKFLRKTSIDVLPQFFNVFVGQMSVVGPRPQMVLHTSQYEHSVDKYLVRHYVKPGVTGLAQVKGFRGEIVRKMDIINRVRMDIFYVEKWSLLMDLQIIGKTIGIG